MQLTTQTATTITDKYWALAAYGVAAGADTEGIVYMDLLLPSKAYADIIVIDGVSGQVTKATAAMHWGINVHTIAQSNPATTIQHRLWYREPAAAVVGDSWSMCNLAIPTELKAGYRLMQVTQLGLAANDTITVSAWGHYVPIGAIPEPAPVSVQEFHLFRPRKVTGPV